MLSIENISKKYNNVHAVNGLSLSVLPGEIYGLLGPNGAGKTTTIRAVLNIIKPDSGIIKYNNKEITADFFNTAGYLPEERGLYKNSRVIDIIVYLARLKNLPRKEALKKANEWLELLQISKYSKSPAGELSKGNQQKVQFITTVIHNPDVLILDEPFSGLDPVNQQDIKELILRFSGEGKIIIISTHQMDTAEKLCSGILLINKGKEVIKGDLDTIKKQSGKRIIRAAFEGDIDLVKNIPYIKKIDQSGIYTNFELDQLIAPAVFLNDLTALGNINYFAPVEVSLESVFLNLIKGEK